MTPAINLAKQRQIAHEVLAYEHDASADSYGEEAVSKLGLPPAEVFKTLVVMADNKELVVAVIPVSKKLNLKLMAKAVAAKKSAMADKVLVEKTTGYVLGGVSPLGQKKPLRTVIDSSAKVLTTMYVSAGKRGLDIGLSPSDLCTLTKASFADIAV
ncbi:Cys-tRNA(Pro) deacylase [Shewanella olleyana]|uniref:Cys-tRNA(Pro) deacylase n=1 Tax=Shewanella olleyana TaxID=135626 RepID=UPI00200D1EDB|nr:Cys-tRNA(Pro) deacylase [Shewanella olleyana]MCL1066687.1 Cys-tRNA(Pro) deacylase [Shewanella olleyana]